MTQFDVLSRHLNPFQSHFLEASAGTGKTFAIEHLVVRLLTEGESPFLLEEILVVTFTRAATRELKKRIHRNLKQVRSELISKTACIDYVQQLCEQGKAKESIERIDAALISYDRAAIYTLHGFCYRLLKEFAFEAQSGPLFSDPDKQPSSLLMEKWIRLHLKEEETLISYSPFQIQQLLKKYRGDPSRLIAALAYHSAEGKTIDPRPTYSELLQGFELALQSLPEIEAAHFVQDLTQLASFYVKMTAKDIPDQIHRLAQIVSTKQCSPSQFDQLLKGEPILELMREENLKKRAKPIETLSLHYPRLLGQLQMTLLPWIMQAKDTASIFLRLAKQVQESAEKVFEKEALFSPDALLFKVKQALKSTQFQQAVRGKFKAAIIDEFQDTDPTQWSIVKTLFLEDPTFTLYLVGDPKQSIYAFRSADVYVYLDAAEKMGSSAKGTLGTNFRSTPNLVNALNHLFARASKRWMALPKSATTLAVSSVQAGAQVAALGNEATIQFFIATDKKGRSRQFPTATLLEKKVYPFLASEILSLHGKMAVSYHAIAILVKDRFQGQAVLESLKRAGIPAQMQRGASLADTEAPLSLKEVLKAVYSSHSLRCVKRALATPLIGWTEERLKGEDKELFAAKAQFKLLHDILEKEGFGQFFHAFWETRWEENQPPLIQRVFQRGESSLYFDLRKLCEVIVEEETLSSIDYVDYVKQLCFDAQKDDPRLQVASVEEQGAVKIMTMHHSKGLEFDVVFALGAGSRHPSSELIVVRQGEKQVITPLNEDDPACRSTLEEIDAEKQRLLYVALTRAKRKLYIPLFLEEEKQTLQHQEASPIELFLAHLSQENNSYEELYKTIRGANCLEALALLKTLEPHVHVHELQEAALPSATPVLSTPVLFPPRAASFSWPKEPLLSFTSLAESSSHATSLSIPVEAPLSVHTMPLGAETGIFIHHLFEQIFKKGLHHPLNETRIRELLFQEIAGSELAPWGELLFPWIFSVLTTPLATFSLADIPTSQLQCEVEFLYPCQAGLMKGFADLFFSFEGNYYLLDWKTNYLGTCDADYTQEKMQEAMRAHQYDLQASIYLEALERHVKLFDNRPFSSCFGGAVYYFVRGRAALHFTPTTLHIL